ncbi:hypothetical protein OSTOST_24624, partial [Ostertagia ostertagi]
MSTVADGMVVCRSYTEKFPDPSNHPVTVALFAVLYTFVFVISFRRQSRSHLRHRTTSKSPDRAEYLHCEFGRQRRHSLRTVHSLNASHTYRQTMVFRLDVVSSGGRYPGDWSVHRHIFAVRYRHRPVLSTGYCPRYFRSFDVERNLVSLQSLNKQIFFMWLPPTAGGDTQQHKEQLTHLIEQKRRVMQQRRRVTLILVSMVVIFGITSLPHNIVSTLMEFTDSHDLLAYNGNDYTYLLNLITH